MCALCYNPESEPYSHSLTIPGGYSKCSNILWRITIRQASQMLKKIIIADTSQAVSVFLSDQMNQEPNFTTKATTFFSDPLTRQINEGIRKNHTIPGLQWKGA
jgi:hypothetical protein